jgi:hypothetical protein
MIRRAIMAFAFVWLMAPHVSDIGVTDSPSSARSPAWRDGASAFIMENVRLGLNALHETVLARIDSVRGDFRANLTLHPSSDENLRDR